MDVMKPKVLKKSLIVSVTAVHRQSMKATDEVER